MKDYTHLHAYIAETPDAVADHMVEIADINPTHRVLEPSAGRGAILKAVQRGMAGFKNKPSVFWCETNRDSFQHLLINFDANLICRDFMELPPGFNYDRIIMNPPHKNLADAEHIVKAWEHLKPGGRIVALLYRRVVLSIDAEYAPFQQWLGMHSYAYTFPAAGAFGDAKVDAVILTINRP